MESVEVREKLVEALRLDLVGPGAHTALQDEVIPQEPSRWYLTGFLVPLHASEAQRMDETSAEDMDEIDAPQASDDAGTPESTTAKRAYFPSSIGMSLLVAAETREVELTVRWGDYEPVYGSGKPEDEENVAADQENGATTTTSDQTLPNSPANDNADHQSSHTAQSSYIKSWKRIPRAVSLTITLPDTSKPSEEYDVPESNGLQVVASMRPVGKIDDRYQHIPMGTQSLSIFLVNRRQPAEDELRDTAFVFQATLEVTVGISLVPRPDLRGMQSKDWDERVADLHYRNICEFAVGHGVATEAVLENGHCHKVYTTWIPDTTVERVAPAPMEGVALEMEVLANLADAAEARNRLQALITQYQDWIEKQHTQTKLDSPERMEVAEELLKHARYAAKRIAGGIALLEVPEVLEAFRICNRVMAIAARQRFAVIRGITPAEVEKPSWRPFQLAFVLMNMQSIVEPEDLDRETVDLLFFPTGGGKTEAYLGLAAFTLVLRRLRNPGIQSAGLSVLMRYTLRLLTLDQLGRAATLICALELERQKNPEQLGEWPFEIGLWVGSAATPNHMGKKEDNSPDSARRKTIAYKNNDRKASPIPLEECPWCGTKFTPNSFNLIPTPDYPTDLRITCINRRCVFTRDQYLPILSVDEPIYRRLPCFLIATVDKFAAMPWTGAVGAFFGKVERYDKQGFYGPCQPGRGSQKLHAPLLPPELVIQDELHLISGPLGTMVGLYETALDELCSYERNGKKIRPKIVASTATVRRADQQIKALFCRYTVDIFPPPGPDIRDSFFARTETLEKSHGRQYVGIAAQGRSLKVLLLRTYLALMGAAFKAYNLDGGKRNKQNAADPYLTLLGYFNSLRELGGSRRIIEDEVQTRLQGYGDRKRRNEGEGLFHKRTIYQEVVELTSRVGTDEVADAKRKLALPFHDSGHIDVAIATNMISVGLDITRLGLMVMLGQPRTSAEYIQASSRVGRDSDRPGLVVTLLNIHRPRDRSHYERFAAYHDSFYRSVEATSVTPFSARALDRGLAGVVVALARLGNRELTPPLGAGAILQERSNLDFVVDTLVRRAEEHGTLKSDEIEELKRQVRERVKDLLDEWTGIAKKYQEVGTQLQYQREIGAAQRLLYEFLHPELGKLNQRHRKFRVNRSLRDVEPTVSLIMKTLDYEDAQEEEV